MKKLLWILVVLLAIACVAAWFRPHEPLSAEIRTETKIKTVVKVDTMLISAPMAVFWRFVPDDTTRIGDTLLHRKQVVYRDSSYQAVVSGYVDPRLDSLQIFPKTVYQTVTNDIYHPVAIKSKKKRWGFGLQAGYGPGGCPSIPTPSRRSPVRSAPAAASPELPVQCSAPSAAAALFPQNPQPRLHRSLRQSLCLLRLPRKCLLLSPQSRK